MENYKEKKLFQLRGATFKDKGTEADTENMYTMIEDKYNTDLKWNYKI